MPFELSMGEVLIILLVAVIVFGGRLPDTARKLGAALSEFKRGMREELRKVEDGVRRDEAPPAWRRPPGETPPAPDAPADPTRPGP